ncbi:MAG: dTDP-4-dehydrorhamnose reductase [candidate division WOR-3 bacterium]|nr:dTDP-4-dehydrorhamnose reductase [candidate division WOR-3 bacterium]MCX7836824.1 dTDP-4-dehydrorhamnose reductase [candidate division WOR-3 bacterium]MDW8113858.1 dTDP-4-dehydrorhamnose reductase [candidate division WOR-3 bacterium]
MKIIITGATGLLGSEVSLYLKEKNYEVIEWNSKNQDITNINDTIKNIKKIKPDVIIHLAAFTNVDKCEEEKGKAFLVNTQGSWAIALGAKEVGCKLIHFSTDYVFNGNKGTPYYENDLPNPINYYGMTKYLAEKKIIETLKKYFIVRTSLLFGKKRENFVLKVYEKGKRKEEIKAPIDVITSPTYVRDLLLPIENLLRSEEYGIYHIVNSDYCSRYDLAKEIIEIAKLNCEVIPITQKESIWKAIRPRFSALNNTKYELTFNHKMRSYKDALIEFINSLL